MVRGGEAAGYGQILFEPLAGSELGSIIESTGFELVASCSQNSELRGVGSRRCRAPYLGILSESDFAFARGRRTIQLVTSHYSVTYE